MRDKAYYFAESEKKEISYCRAAAGFVDGANCVKYSTVDYVLG